MKKMKLFEEYTWETQRKEINDYIKHAQNKGLNSWSLLKFALHHHFGPDVEEVGDIEDEEILNITGLKPPEWWSNWDLGPLEKKREEFLDKEYKNYDKNWNK